MDCLSALEGWLLAGTDQIIAMAIRWWEFGLHVSMFYSVSPSVAEPLGCHASALTTESKEERGCLEACCSALGLGLMLILTMPVVLPLGLFGMLFWAPLPHS